MRIAFTTLGCKINQYETDLLRQDLAARGNTIVPFDAEADIYVINTCSVTAKSDMQCRQTIRSAVRRGVGAAKVVVTGCYAETRPDEIRNIPGVNLVVGNRDKSGIADHPLLAGPEVVEQGRDSSQLRAVSGRTRAFLKIQDGCDNHCSYCIVPLARGGSRSCAPSAVMNEFDRLVREGSAEIVLTGIHIGTYGADLSGRVNLTDILAELVARRGCSRIRLSSIEPREITEGIIRFLGSGICRHLHVPLQSGDDIILASMKRNYTASFYRDLLERIVRDVPGIALGADVMVGYPGEGDAEFKNTMRLVESVPITHLHVFSYSPRPGTAAALMNEQVPEQIKKERSETLRRLGNEKNYSFRKTQEGACLSVVVEDKVDPHTGMLSGLTDNYIRVLISGAARGEIGKKIQVRITDVKKGENFAIHL
jgi:threonylcarbamoyladenosine tRNA methylthiotransferase MtaB